MRLYEYEGLDIFEGFGIPVPRRGVAESTEDALLIAGEIGYPVVLKAQVLVGGRGLAGGVKPLKRPKNSKRFQDSYSMPTSRVYPFISSWCVKRPIF